MSDSINYNTNQDVRVSRLASFGLVFSSVNGILRFFTYFTLSNTMLGSYITLIIWCLFLGYTMYRVKNIVNKIIFSIICYSIFIAIMYLFFPLSGEWIESYFNDLLIYMLVGMPMMIVISRIRDWKLLIDVATPVFRVVAILTCATYVLSGGSFFSPMEWGNRVMPIALAYTALFAYRRDKIDFVILPTLIFFSLLGGRQSFAVVIAGLLVVFLFSKSKSYSLLVGKFLLFLSMILLVLFLEPILNLLIEFLYSRGISARSLEKLSSGFLEDSGRTKIYSACIEIIKNNGIKVNGIFSDHYYVVQANVGKNYLFAHNFALEILIDFGTLLGGIILVWLFFILIRRVIDCKPEYKQLLFLFILYGMGRIAVSSSIFIYFNFIILMGFLFNDCIYNYRFRFVI